MNGKRILSIVLALALLETSFVLPVSNAGAKKSPVSVPKKISLTIKSGNKRVRGVMRVKTIKKVKVKKLVFKTLNAKVAKVDKKGVLIGISAGTATIKTAITYKYKKKTIKAKFVTKVYVKNKNNVKSPRVSDHPSISIPTKSSVVSTEPAKSENPVSTIDAVPVQSSDPTVSDIPSKSERPETSAGVLPEKSENPKVTASVEPVFSDIPKESEKPEVTASVFPVTTEAPEVTKNPLEDPPLVSAEPTVCPAGRHQWEFVEGESKEATCATVKDGKPLSLEERKGYLTKRCKICGYNIIIDISPLNHSFVSVEEQATCTLPARVSEICRVCGEKGVSTVVDGSSPLGHVYHWNVTVAASCTHSGIQTYQCLRCNDVTKDKDGQSVKEIPVQGHDMVNGVCRCCHKHFHSFDLDEKGYEIKDDNMGWEVVIPTGSAVTGSAVTTGASFDVPRDIAATCTQAGISYRRCSDCHILECKVIKAHGHKDSGWQTVKEPSCSASGTSIRVCTECGAVRDSKEISPTGHSYKWTVTKQATCTDPGEELLKCTNKDCDDVKTDENGQQMKKVDPALGHKWGDEQTVLPSCTKIGYIKQVCDRCNEERKKEGSEIAALGHQLAKNPALSEPATCTASGYDYMACQRSGCGYGEKITVNALDHNWVDGSTVDPTCTEYGYIPQTCSRCNATREKPDSRKNPLGHRMVKNTSLSESATCTVSGYDYMVCQRSGCDHTEKKTVNALGHDTVNGQWVETTEPTCTTTGVSQYQCGRCKEYISVDGFKPQIVAARGHSWIDGTTVAPTCTEYGYIPQTCSRCNATREKPDSKKNALGHHWSSTKKTDNYGKIVNLKHEKDCQNYAAYYRWCDRCGIASNDLSAADQKALFEDKGESLTWDDVDGGKLSHSGGSYNGTHSGESCVKVCTNKLWNGSVCGAYYDVKKISSVNGRTKDVHSKCESCGKTLSSSHSYDFVIDLTSKVESAAHQPRSNDCLMTVTMPSAAGKNLNLSKLSLTVTKNKTALVAICSTPGKINNVLRTPVTVTGDSSGKATISSQSFTVPSNGKFYINVADCSGSSNTYVGWSSSFEFKDAKCGCGYSFLGDAVIEAGAK